MRFHRPLPAYRVYLITSFFESLFSMIVFTATGVYAVQEVGLNPLQLVLVGTALEASAFLFEVPTGVVADVYSRRLSVIIGVALIGAGFIVWGSWPLFATVLLAQVLWGIGSTFTSGAREAWLADEIGEARAGPAYLRAVQLAQVASLLAIPIGVALATVNLALPIRLGGMLMLVLAAVLALVMPEHGFHPAPRDERGSWQSMRTTFLGGVAEVRRRPYLLTFLVISVLFGAFSEAYDRLRDIHFIAAVGFPSAPDWQPVVWLNLIAVVGMALSVAAGEVARRRVDTTNYHATAFTLLWLNAGLLVTVLAFALAPGFGIAAGAIWAGGVMRRLIMPLGTAWVNQGIDPAVRATLLSMRGQADAFGQIGGGPLLGLLAAAVSVRFSFLAAAVVLALTLPLYARALRGSGAGRSGSEAMSRDA